MAIEPSAITLTKGKFMFIFLCNCLFASAGARDGRVAVMCKDKEREALLALRQGLTNMYDYGTNISSWGSTAEDNMDCCNWDGVTCRNKTGHVIGLMLSQLRGEISPALLELRHVRSIDLILNDFGGNKIPECIGSLTKLEYLRLPNNNFSGDVPYQLGNLTNLMELDLSSNHLASKNLTWISNLALLSKLDFSNNDFEGSLTWLSSLSLLSFLDVSNNQFKGPFPNLKLKSLSSLTCLFLGHNRLAGQLPKIVGQFLNLQNLDVSHNFLEGKISEVHFSKLKNLKFINLSFNSLALNFTPGWVPPFQLDYIRLGGCDMGGRLPSWLQTQRSFSVLEIPSAGISGKLPSWFWGLSDELVSLNLSNNQISGPIRDLSLNFRAVTAWVGSPIIDISFNNFSGPLPVFHPYSSILLLSHNTFTGSIHSLCGVKFDSLTILDLSNNQFSSELPNCWENMTELLILNLADNQFHGNIPNSFGALVNLRTLRFRNNNLTGEFPSTLKNCEYLQLIDGGGNALTGNIPRWIGALAKLSTLTLPKNNLSRSIPPEICLLTSIQVLDLSRNNVSGRIPQCFNNFSSLVLSNMSTEIWRLDSYADDIVVVQWKRQESQYKNNLGLLNLIDLSSNKLVGNIPQEVFDLAKLISLNLSHNILTGHIDVNIDQMKMLECLDLSRNRLSGEIPAGLAQLGYLNVLDLSSNELSGEIPKGTQLQTFDLSSYSGNRLCGQPLSDCPRDVEPTSSSHQTREGDTYDKSEIFISAAIGSTVGFWVVIGPLLYKKTWRDAYFGYLSKIGYCLCMSATTCCRRRLR